MRRIAYIIDPNSRGCFHEVINASYLYFIASSYEKVIYITHKSAYDNSINLLLKYGLNINNIELKPINITKYNGAKFKGFKYLLNHYISAIEDIKYYIRSEKGTDVFFNQNILLGLNTINRIVKIKGNRVFIMCHSELGMLERKGSFITRPEYITRYFLKRFLKSRIDKNLFLLVLGDNIKNKLQLHTSKCNCEQIKSIDHTYFRIPIQVNYKEELISKRQYKIGIPSLINKNRGLDSLIYLLENSNENRFYDIYAIGRVVTEREIDNIDLIRLNNSSELLSTEKYIYYTNKMDAMIFFVSDNNFGASGGILEAIWNEKIILTIENGYARYIFNKFGQMGYIFKDINSMTDFLNNNFEELFYKQEVFKFNLKKAKDSLRPENMVHLFGELIK